MEHYKISIDAFNKLASNYQEKFMDVDLYNGSYDHFIGLIDKTDAEILDIGCGPGNITRYLLSKEANYRVLGIDMAPNMIDLAQKNNPAAEFKTLDCLRINELNKKFDGIICGFCMPYLSKEDCSVFISAASSVLNNDGILYLSVIEGNPADSGFEISSNGKAKAFVYYYEEEFIKNEINRSELELVSVFRIPYQKDNGIVQTHLIFIAKRNQVSVN